jgi:hypothetical protein
MASIDWETCPGVVVICAGTRRFHRLGCRVYAARRPNYGGFPSDWNIARMAKMRLPTHTFCCLSACLPVCLSVPRGPFLYTVDWYVFRFIPQSIPR